MKIVYCGNNERGISCLENLLKFKKYKIELVITHYKSSNGYFRSIKEISKKNNLIYINPKNINNKRIQLKIRKINPDIMILVGYSQNILSEETFKIPKFGTINLHASPLPYYRGGSPLNWMIINGEKKIGISIIQVDTGIDTGPILAQKFFKLSPNETINKLVKRVNKLYPILLRKTLNKINKLQIKKIIQNRNEGTYFPKRKPEDGQIKFNTHTSSEIYRLVRALQYPYPGAYFYYKKNKIQIYQVAINKTDFCAIPGTIIKFNKNNLIIRTNDTAINIKKIVVNGIVKKINHFKFRVGENVL